MIKRILFNCSKKFLVGILLIIASLSYAKGNATTESIEANKSSLSEDDITPLQSVPIDELRKAKDSETGTLYYAGLLWYFNDQVDNALIAWKRSARTGHAPWKLESMRLVAYTLILESRFNQVVPFLESVTSVKALIHDPELFSYYTFALWKDKDYNTLSDVLSQVSPELFVPTLRNRVSISQAKFNITMWKTMLQIVDDIDQAEQALRYLFTQHSVADINSEVSIILSQLVPLESLPKDISTYLEIHEAYGSNSKKIFNLYLTLPNEYFQSPWIVIDFMKIVSYLSLKYRNTAQKNLEQVLQEAKNPQTKIFITNALAEIYYRKGEFKRSRELYYQFIENSIVTPKNSHSVYNVSRWRYLYSIIQESPEEFFEEFFRITNIVENPDYFANLLEEFLSKLLQKQQWDLVKNYYDTYRNNIKHPAHKIEFFRWESILSRLDKNYSVDFSLIKNPPFYHSDTPYDYFINQKNQVSIASFIDDWASIPPESITDNDIDLFIKGYLEFGLLEYAYSVALENTSTINSKSVLSLVSILNKQELYYKSITLIRIVAAKNATILNSSEIFNFLYPTPFLDIVESLTTSNIEKALIMGIMREESSFNKNARSGANAIGLTQMLLPTAKDIASRINFNKKITLTNPVDNITLGYHYYKYLVRVLESPLKAIASYNGGLGNVWKWEDRYNTDSLVIFADSLPFRETRNYVRKVTASAMIYGLLYFDLNPKSFQEYLLK